MFKHLNYILCCSLLNTNKYIIFLRKLLKILKCYDILLYKKYFLYKRSIFFGAYGRDRTADLLITNQLLCQLSHTSTLGQNALLMYVIYHIFNILATKFNIILNLISIILLVNYHNCLNADIYNQIYNLNFIN